MQHKTKKAIIRPIEPDERVLQVVGRCMPCIRDMNGLHKQMLEVANPMRLAASKGVATNTLHDIEPHNPSKRRYHKKNTNLTEWRMDVEAAALSVAADCVSFESDAFATECVNRYIQNLGTAYPPYASVLIVDNPKRLGLEKYSLAQMARAAVEALDADGNCTHALVDYDYAGGYINYGHMYGAFPLSPMTWRMWVDFVDWGTLGEAQATTVRRVVWGTYLGPRMVERLSKNFIDDYLALTTTYFGSPQTAERLTGGGIYLTLTDNPRDQVEHEEFPDIYERPIVRNAAWLRQRLREAGML